MGLGAWLHRHGRNRDAVRHRCRQRRCNLGKGPMPLMLVPQGATMLQSSSVCGDRATMLWECVVRIGGFGCGRSVASNWPCWPYSRSLRMGLPGSCCCASDRRGPSVDTLCLLCSSSLGRLLCVHAIFRARFFALYMQVCFSFFFIDPQ